MEYLESIIEEVRSKLNEEWRISEEAKNVGREVIRKSKRAILLGHKMRLAEASESLEEARKSLESLKAIASNHPETVYTSFYRTVCQEYVEAYLYLCYLKGIKPNPPSPLGVDGLSYALGLADLVGELRRSILENLRLGCLKEAESKFRFMVELYEKLFSLDNPYALSGGLRRKIDAARRMVEATESELLFELGRRSLIEALKKISGFLEG